MRILHYIREVRLEHGGVVRAVLDMCRYQALAGHEVTLACCDGTDVPWTSGSSGAPRVEVLPGPRRFGRFDPAFTERVRASVAAADVVHLHVLWDPVQLAFVNAARAEGRPYVQSPHGVLINRFYRQKWLKKRSYLSVFGHRLLNGASFVVATAQAELDESRRHHPHTPGVVIPLIVDIEPFRRLPGPDAAMAAMGLPAELPKLVHLSLMLPTKRPDVIIATAGELRRRGLEVALIMAGPVSGDTERALRHTAAKQGLNGNIYFPGMVTDLKASLLQASDLFLLPSKAENFGLAAFESLACGTAVLTTRTTATWRELEASGGGVAVQPFGDDAREFHDAAAALLQDRHALRGRGALGRRWVLENLEPAHVVQRYIDMYQRAIDGKK
jgi:glycosyltransferase involved in cell wall biosynthesis